MINVIKCLANRTWQRRVHPFPHFLAENVFTDSVYQALASAFEELLDRGLAECPDPNRFSRSVGGYDVYALNFQPTLSEAFGIFLSREWHDLLALVVGVAATGDVKGGFHHHAVGSSSGRPHNDLNPGWFSGKPLSKSINLANHLECNYHNGAIGGRDVVVRETVRAAAMLFYLNNPVWRPGDGGETGLYSGRQLQVELTDATIPPANNSLLLFECTPYSYHAFLANHVHPRNSVIMWIHREMKDAL